MARDSQTTAAGMLLEDKGNSSGLPNSSKGNLPEFPDSSSTIEREKMVTHDWDNEDYEQTLETAWEDYRRACYGETELPAQQTREVKQAFLSGAVWLSTRDDYCPQDVQEASRVLLVKMLPQLHGLLGIDKLRSKT